MCRSVCCDRIAEAVRIGQWKAVRPRGDAAWALYDLDKAPAESENIVKEHPEVLARVRKLLETVRVESEHWPFLFDPFYSANAARNKGKTGH